MNATTVATVVTPKGHSPSEIQLPDAEQAVLLNSTTINQDPAEQIALFFDNSFVCPIAGCHAVFTIQQAYRQHRAKAHGLPRFNCIVCSEPFDSHNDLVKHMSLQNHTIVCIRCSLPFKRPQDAHSHYKMKHREFTCYHCFVNIQGENELKTHLQLHNEEGSPFNAASYVEVAINSSFSDSFYDLSSEVKEVNQNDGRIELGHLPIILGDDASSEPPDSTSPKDPASPRVQLRVADSSTMTCSETDTAEAESYSDTDMPPTNNNNLETDEGDGSCVSTVEAVVFGPGASELFNGGSMDEFQTAESAQLSPFKNNKDNSMEWIGHNVDMYQLMSEKHKKTFRYNCSKCSCSFKNKDILKRHLNIHDFVCKHCFLRFNSLGDYKSHCSQEHSKPRTFQCSVCSHSLQGLLSLMVHEMTHRLNLAFKREAEDAIQADSCHTTQLEYFECLLCQELIKGFSKFVRHKVWHTWESMWNTYVTGRIFKGTFSHDEAQKFEKEVAEKLEMKWRDCCAKKKSTSEILDSSLVPKAVAQIDANNEADQNGEADELDTSVVSTLPPLETHKLDANYSISNNCDDEETDTESETSEGVRVSINGWMSYWNSYLGLGECVPTWVKPIMKNLRKQWKAYSTDEMGPLYKQMDQIATLIRAYKNEASSLDGPIVSVERLPMGIFEPMISHSLPVKNHRSATNSIPPTNRTLGLPPSIKRMRSTALNSLKKATKINNHIRQKRSFRKTRSLKRTSSWRSKVENQPLSVQKSLRDERSLKPFSQLRTSGKLCQKNGSPKKVGEHTTLVPEGSGNDLRNETKDSGNEDISPKISKCLPQPDSCERLGDQTNHIPFGSTEPKEDCRRGLKSPLVVLSRLNLLKPVVLLERVAKPVKPCSPSPPPTSDYSKMISWVQKRITCHKIPRWASSLIGSICKSSLAQDQKMHKFDQVITLIKIAHGDIERVQTPVVKVIRCS